MLRALLHTVYLLIQNLLNWFSNLNTWGLCLDYWLCDCEYLWFSFRVEDLSNFKTYQITRISPNLFLEPKNHSCQAQYSQNASKNKNLRNIMILEHFLNEIFQNISSWSTFFLVWVSLWNLSKIAKSQNSIPRKAISGAQPYIGKYNICRKYTFLHEAPL